MDPIPIQISANTPSKSTANKPSGREEIAQADKQEFGNVLARQLEEAGQADESANRPDTDSATRATAQDKTEDHDVADADTTLQSALLVALLLQQPLNQPGQAVATPQDKSDQAEDLLAQTLLEEDPALDTDKNSSKTDKPEITSATLKGSRHADKTDATERESTLSPLTAQPLESAIIDSSVKRASREELSALNAAQPLHDNTTIETGHDTPPPTSLQLASTANTPASSSTLNTLVTQPAWADEFGQKITWMANQRNQSAELHLNPPQLGPLDVSLTIKGDQASALFTSPHAAVREAIEAALPKLREMLADSGIMLGNAMVSDQSSKNGQEHINRNPQGGVPANSTAEERERSGLNEARISSPRLLKGMVDTFA